MQEIRAFRRGEREERRPRERLLGTSASAREEMSAQRGSNSRSYSADPRPNLPERPENQAFPLNQADRQTDLRAEINHFR